MTSAKLRTIILTSLLLVSLITPLIKVNASSEPLPLGTAQSVNDPQACPSGAICKSLKINCSSVQDADIVTLAEFNPSGTPKGTLLLFTGGGGSSWYKDDNYPTTVSLFNSLISDGFRVIEAAWFNPWTSAADGERAGIVKLSCRPATTIKWVYDNKYAPLDIHVDKVGKCGFCVVGTSGGATQGMYSLGYYGLDNIINAVIAASGPPYAALTKGCLGVSGYAYDEHSMPRLDGPYGFLGHGGPCETQNAKWTPYWDEDSIDKTANDYYHASTRIAFLLGSHDPTMQNHVTDYKNKLIAADTPYMSYQVVEGATHEFEALKVGADAVHASVLADTGVSIGGGGSSGGGSGSGDGSSNNDQTNDNGATSTQNNQTDQNSKPNDNNEPTVKNLGDVPSALVHSLANPTDLLDVLKGNYGWLIGLVLLTSIVGASFGLFWLHKKYNYTLPWLSNYSANATKAIKSNTEDLPPQPVNTPGRVVQPDDGQSNDSHNS